MGGDRLNVVVDETPQLLDGFEVGLRYRLGAGAGLLDVGTQDLPQQLLLRADVVVERAPAGSRPAGRPPPHRWHGSPSPQRALRRRARSARGSRCPALRRRQGARDHAGQTVLTDGGRRCRGSSGAGYRGCTQARVAKYRPVGQHGRMSPHPAQHSPRAAGHGGSRPGRDQEESASADRAPNAL